MNAMNDRIHLLGRVKIMAELLLKSGLRIGASDTGISVGTINAIIRNPITTEPYVPGSSLKGKLRSLFEKAHARPQNKAVQRIRIHVCEKQSDYDDCPVCPIFGVSADDPEGTQFPKGAPTRIIVRDAALSETTRKDPRFQNLESEFSELKTEVAIDRLTSRAVPRTQERVPAGASFDFEAVFNFHDRNDGKHFLNFCQSMRLLEQDFLGGSGSRGYGQVLFKSITLTRTKAKTFAADEAPKKYETSDDEAIHAIDKLLADESALGTWLMGKLETQIAASPQKSGAGS